MVKSSLNVDVPSLSLERDADDGDLSENGGGKDVPKESVVLFGLLSSEGEG